MHDPDSKIPDFNERRTRCPLCDAQLDPANLDECPKCDWVRGYRHRQKAGNQRDRIAVLLSVIPGLGHWFKGHRLLALVLVVGTFAVVLGVVATAAATVLWSLVLLPFYWAGVMLHAYYLEDLAHPGARSPA